MATTTRLPPIEELLPHRGIMLFIDRLLEFDGARATAECTPRAGAWYADGHGDMPAWIGIELMAQTVAAHVGLQKRALGLPAKHGALLGTRRYASAVASFRAGAALEVRVAERVRDASGLGAYDCSIAREGSELASATVKVYEPDDFAAFLEGQAT